MAVFRKNNGKIEVLLGLRLNNPGKGKWSFPGGGAEGKEKLIAAGIREFREEVGVRLYDRYITKIGLYKIKSPLFDWETQIIETTQNIDLKGVGSLRRMGQAEKPYGGEFARLEWIALEDLAHLRLHRWVREVIRVYQSNQMKPYTLKLPAKKKIKKSSSVYRTLQEEFDFLGDPCCLAGFNTQSKHKEPSGSDILFDIAEMVLTKVDPDGTRYFMPRYAPAVPKSKVVKQRTAVWK